MARWFRGARRAPMVFIIILINLAVFAMWHTGHFSEEYMAQNFLVSWEALADGRWWVLITADFSHLWALHILVNLFVLNSFGRILEQVLGSRVFLGFYLVAGVVSSLSHALTSNFFVHKPDLPALGASGSIAGLILVFALMFPREKILLFGIVPVPALWGALAFVGFDIWGLVEQSEGSGLPIGHGAHLGGALTGLLFYLFFVRRRLRRIPE